jgi:hypothetical protein
MKKKSLGKNEQEYYGVMKVTEFLLTKTPSFAKTLDVVC